MYTLRCRVAALLVCSLFVLGCPKPSDDELVVLVPEDPDIENCFPWKVRGGLEVEVAHNIYDGLFNPSVPQGYERGLAEELDIGLRDGEGESDEAIVRLRLDRTWIDAVEGGAQAGKPVDAYDVVAAWEEIAKNPRFPGGSRYWSAVDSISAEAPDTLKVRFKTAVDASRRAQEALSFRVFPVPSRRSIPEGSGPFYLKFPPAREQFRFLLPSESFPSAKTGVDRPRILVRSVLSSRDRLDQILSEKAHVALGIPPYYLHETAGTKHRETDPYNVWALVFNHQTLSLEQRQMLAARIDAEELLQALLPRSTAIERQQRLSPTIFPRAFEVFDCIENRRQEGLISDPDLRNTADRLEKLKQNAKDFYEVRSAQPPEKLRIAYLQAGAFREGMKRMAAKLEDSLEKAWPKLEVSLDGQQPGEWSQTLRDLNAETQFDVAIVRFAYRRRCDVSGHFEKAATPSPQQGLFSWVADTPQGQVLTWNSDDLKEFRDAGNCDAAVLPALRVIQAVYDVAPAKFLFSVPSLTVFRPTVDLEVHDEYVLAGLKDWHVVPQ